jgi:hypothetical protein
LIQYLINKEIDKDKWDKTVSASPNGLIYSFSWYLDIVSPGWDALVFGDYESIMPLPIRSKWKIRYLFRPYWCQQLGIVSPGPVSRELIEDFIRAIPREIRFIDMPMNFGNICDPPLKDAPSRDNFVLPMPVTYSELNSRYSTNTLRNLKKAEALFVKIGGIQEVEQLIDLKWKFADSPLKKHHREIILALHNALAIRKLVLLRGAFDADGSLLAGVLFIHHQSRWIYLVSASSREGKEHRAMFLLLDQFIQEHAATDAILDFEGSSIPALARFFSGFGAIPEKYPYLHINRLPWPVKRFKTS